MPHLTTDDGVRLYYEEAGSGHPIVLVHEVAGLRISEVFPPSFNAEVHYHWSSCVDRQAPVLGSGRLWVAERNHVAWEGIVLPLSPDAASVNMLLGGAIFTL